MEVVDPELYMYDGEVLAKAAELGKPGLIDICQRQVGPVVSMRGRCPEGVGRMGRGAAQRRFAYTDQVRMVLLPVVEGSELMQAGAPPRCRT